MSIGHDCALIGASDDLLGVTCPIGPDGVMVGRSLEAVLRLHSDGVSRFHARIECSRQGTLVLSDLGSSNGTYVNGRRVQRPEPLQDGDRIRFGPRASFVVRYGHHAGGRDTLEVVVPSHARASVELLAKRNQARMLIGQKDYAEARTLLLEVLDAVDERRDVQGAATEDVAELLIELGRCHVGLGERHDAVPLCRRAIALLMGTSSGSKSLARAKFVLGQALFPDAPEEGRRVIEDAAGSLEPGSALRQELEAWLAVADPASRS